MKKKKSLLLLTTLFTLGSALPAMASSVSDTSTALPTFSYSAVANESFKKVNDHTLKDLTERKAMLQDTIYGNTFSTLSLGEKLVLVESYFTAKANIHKENQKTVLSATDFSQLQELEKSLIIESDNANKDNQLISALVQEVKEKDMSTLTNEEILLTKEKMFKVIEAYKAIRGSGKDLNVLIDTQMKVSHSTQLRMLNKLGSKYELSGDKKQALEVNKKILKLTEGDIEAFKRVSNLLIAENKLYFYLDNEVIELSTPFLKKEKGQYIHIFDLSKVSNFTVLNEEKQTSISNGDNILLINKENGLTQFNGNSIGSNLAIIENEKLYIPIRSTFELFNYTVESKPDFGEIVIQKEVYETNEIDLFTSEQLVGGLFPEVKIEEKSEIDNGIKESTLETKQDIKEENNN